MDVILPVCVLKYIVGLCFTNKSFASGIATPYCATGQDIVFVISL